MHFRKMNESKPLMTRRKHKDNIKTSHVIWVGINSEITYLSAEWCSALRWHDSKIGFYMERGNLRLQCQRKIPSCITVRKKVQMCNQEADLFVVVKNSMKIEGAKKQNYSVTLTSQLKWRNWLK